jgi:hypothetical protein
VRLVAVLAGPEQVFQAIREFDPHIVGFSLIFQYLVPQFASLLSRLRSKGVTTHFKVGGHYASFEPLMLFEAIPELDSDRVQRDADNRVHLFSPRFEESGRAALA